METGIARTRSVLKYDGRFPGQRCSGLERGRFYELPIRTRETAWCPGCGNFAILDRLKAALEQLEKDLSEVVLALCGQDAQYPAATPLRASRAVVAGGSGGQDRQRGRTVIVNTGDGDSYGGRGTISCTTSGAMWTSPTCPRQPNLRPDQGQASPTSDLGLCHRRSDRRKHPSAFEPGAGDRPPAGFVARAFTGRREQLIDLMKQAITHKGYALVDILQPCVTNKVNTVHLVQPARLRTGGSPTCPTTEAMRRAMEFGDRIPLAFCTGGRPRLPSARQPRCTCAPLSRREPDLALVDHMIRAHQ